ncbi:putative beta-lysine N-acetyltransferase [Clostridium fermenticellae]|uniref:Putative beta-lysine N-acetyltransferase n=1 Tax=Clostridium fermenticellae TaxID=2068654 RepID=A0A386H4S0_9CLOT|nr:putative beta-lysine N-acetyltransferase [Clostridium fermenticellae]AYD40751.1 putative beta-lysine N-acetyltransferase [Clostridium fermenticellae]
MNSAKCKLNNNYYARIDKVKIYIDYVNSRVKIINFYKISVQALKRIIHFTSKQHLSKVVCNCNSQSFQNFCDAGFIPEGKIDSYFRGEDALCMSYFISSNRKICKNSNIENLFLTKSLNMKDKFKFNNNLKYHIRDAKESDISELISLFSEVFFAYPTSIYNRDYLIQNMSKNVLCKVAVFNDKIISAASAYLDYENLNAEIADCATYPHYRDKGIISNIIYLLEKDIRDKDFISLYSMSKSTSQGMNIALSKQGYNYRGTLVNNCNLCGDFESMNIWAKDI